MKIFTKNRHRSIPAGIEFELPDFCVLTGANGSGKTHILEAMSNLELTSILDGDYECTKVLYVPYNGLDPKVDDACDTNKLAEQASSCWRSICQLKSQYDMEFLGGEQYKRGFSNYVAQKQAQGHFVPKALERILVKTGKDLELLTEFDIYENIDYSDVDGSSLFQSHWAAVFKGYQSRLANNMFNEFLISKGEGEGLAFLSKKEFFIKYGPPPWDLLNEILVRASLPYRFSEASLRETDFPYYLRLIDKVSGEKISINDLSSGEKVLMSLALAIYNQSNEGLLPKVLLLDEPDAPLHPMYSKLMMEILVEVLAKRAGMKVVMTTHSLATVAMAPENSVYEINRINKVPEKISNSRAISILAHGVRHLRVSYEQRRQIFVEHSNDVRFYEGLFEASSRKYTYEYLPVFMAPHNGSSNCTDVISIVGKFKGFGNDLVCGIIDYDNKNESQASIFVLGYGKRYAIENYLLDPLYVVLALIKNNKKSFKDFGLVLGRHRYVNANCLTEHECQVLVDFFLEQAGIFGEEVELVELENGYRLKYPVSFLRFNGHHYEELIRKSFVGLNALTKAQGSSALKLELVNVICDFPQFLPVEIAKMFSDLGER